MFTSGGGNGTNLAVIRGALRACNPDLLTVILPQSLYLQPPEMQVHKFCNPSVSMLII